MTEHRILIDWISFSMDATELAGTKVWSIQNNLDKLLLKELGDLWITMNSNIKSWELSSGRAPYKQSYRSGTGISLYYNVGIGHMLMEISGQGCDWLRSIGILADLVKRTCNRITRIDLAVDLTTTTSPAHFLAESQSARFKSRGTVTSDTGQTEYIGSRKSERYCRVYRYAPPHPRSDFLRAEFVFKKDNAKLFCQQAIECDFNLTALALGAGMVYGFEHADWSLHGDEIPLTSYTPERRQGKTVMWLISQVAPAFKRMVQEGVIEDPEQFIREFFLDA